MGAQGRRVVARTSGGAEALGAIADGVSLNLDTVTEAEASAIKLQAKLQVINRLTNAAPAEVAGEFDACSDRPILRISRRHHGNIKSSVITQDFVHGADYKALADAADTFVVCWGRGARDLRRGGQGARGACFGLPYRDEVADHRAERTTARQRYKGLGEMNPEQLWETTMDPPCGDC